VSERAYRALLASDAGSRREGSGGIGGASSGLILLIEGPAYPSVPIIVFVKEVAIILTNTYTKLRALSARRIRKLFDTVRLKLF